MNSKLQGHLDLLVVMLKMAKKLIIFLVEGITEKISFGAIFSEIISNKNIEFKIVHGDITSEYSISYQNIKEKIKKQIENFLENEHYNKSDIKQINHIVDTDGTFISSKRITKHNKDYLIYKEDEILTNNITHIKNRNKKKCRILKKLFKSSKIYGIPYKIYYLSCNLEHVLHNIPNIEQNEKKRALAEKFEYQYSKNEMEFLKFIRSKNIAVNLDYIDSWKYITKNNNSLKRNSNLHLIFENY